MVQCKKVIEHKYILSQLYANRYSDVSDGEVSDRETLDSDIAASSSGKWLKPHPLFLLVTVEWVQESVEVQNQKLANQSDDVKEDVETCWNIKWQTLSRTLCLNKYINNPGIVVEIMNAMIICDLIQLLAEQH